MFTTGFPWSRRPSPSRKTARPKWLQAQAAKYNAVITGSVIIQAADGSHRNRLLWARPDGEVLHYDKRHLFRMAGEHKHYTPASARCSSS
jgi:predicted amidohydrolase